MKRSQCLWCLAVCCLVTEDAGLGHVSNMNLSKVPHIFLDKRRRSKFGTKTRPWTGRPRNHGSIPGKGNGIFSKPPSMVVGPTLPPFD